MSRNQLLFLLALFLGFAAPSHADKVVRLYNPWLEYGSVVDGKIHLVNYYPLANFGPAGTTNVFAKVSGPWLELTIPAALLPAGSVNFTVVVDPGGAPPYYQSFGSNGLAGGDLDLGTPLTTSDTVWIIPSPLPAGSAKVLTTAPKEMTVMFWNPFEFDAAAQRPSMRVETGAWKVMDSVRGAPNWYSSYTLGFTNLSLTFRNADSTRFYGQGGIGLPVAANFDSLVTRNDTIWVWASAEPSGPPKSSPKLPRLRTIMLLNPWDGLIPVQRPRINFGAGPLSMRPDPSYCGWSVFQFIDRTPSVTLSNAKTGVVVGQGGFGSTAPIDLSVPFSQKDTAWITTVAGTGVPTVRSAYTGEKGLCEITLLAATVHDFDSSHPNFEEGASGSCGLVRGMVAPVLGPDRKPKAGPNHCREDNTRIIDQFLTTQWFQDVPGVNATTCRDIPLALDSTNGNYRYDNTSYFPIDDFTTLANGQPNPQYQLFNGGSDGKLHNFHYCLESHGEFDYKAGQKFSFRGDDDVWFFIDNRLAVDLGGVHNPDTGSVLLDTMRLIEGKTYNFDFFYCERQTIGANMRIETSMNLRTPSGFVVADTVRSAGVRSFDLYISQRLGQGCGVNDNIQRTAGRFTLSGPPFNPPITLPGGISYGGINIDPTFGRMVFDSSKVGGLPPGTYTIRILPAGSDTSGARSVVFVVPMNALPFFETKPAYSGLVGSSLPVRVVSRTSAGLVDPNPVSFTIHPIIGLRYFRDSLLTSEILPGDTLRTGASGNSRRYWVRGEAVGDYTLRVGLTALDTVDLYPSVSFRNRLLRYTDSLGAALVPVPAIDRDVRTAQHVWIEAVSGGTTCLACSDTILLTGSPELSFLSAPGGPSISSTRLVSGRASFWVYGKAPLSNGVFRATTADSAAAAPWSPVTFRAPRLRFTDSAGVDLSSISLELGQSGTVWVRALPGVDSCVGCDAAGVRLAIDRSLVVSLARSGIGIDSVGLVGRVAKLWIRPLAPLSGGIVVAVADSLWARDTLIVSASAQKLRFVDSSGADLPSISGEILEPIRVWLEVQGQSGGCTTCDQAVRLLPSDPALVVSATATGPSIPSANLVGGRVPLWIRSNKPLTGASLVAVSDSLFAADTLAVSLKALRIRFVDSVGTDLPSLSGTVRRWVQVWIRAEKSSGVCASCTQFVSIRSSDPELRVSSTAGGARLDSLALVGGMAFFWIEADATTNSTPLIADAKALWAMDTLLVTFAANPPDSAVWLDRDGDGAADRLLVHLAQPWRPNSSMEVSWPSDVPLFDADSGTFSLSVDSLIVQWDFPKGLASLVTRGPLSRGVLDWDGRTTLPFPIQDRIAPVPLRASLRYGTSIDTVRIPWSEIVEGGFLPSEDLVLVTRSGAWSPAKALMTIRDSVAGELVLLYSSSDPDEPQPGDSLRFSPTGTLRDRFGNVPAENARRVLLQGTDRAPLDAVMRDSDGDGRADQVVLRLRSALTVTEAFRFFWPSAGGLDSRLLPVDSAEVDSMGRILTFDVSPFEYGMTSCPAVGCANLGVMLSTWGSDTSSLGFPVRDEVAPAPLRVRLRYAPGATGPDTLVVEVSEPISGRADVGSAWFSTGRPSATPEGVIVSWTGFLEASPLSTDGRIAKFLVDTSFHIKKGDSLRIVSTSNSGTVRDSVGNGAKSRAAWVEIDLGPHPILMIWKPMPAVRTYGGWTPPSDEPALQILVRDRNGQWVHLDGSKPSQDTSHYGGIYLKVNRAMEGSAYLYDNLGIFVADLSLGALTQAILAGAIEPDDRGNYEVWISWNGTSLNRAIEGGSKVVPSGVYIFRILSYYMEGDRNVMLNQVVKTGWKH